MNYRFMENLPTDSDLGQLTLQDAVDLYRRMGDGTVPSSIAVSPEQTELAYELVNYSHTLRGMLVVPFPGLPRDSWFVVGPKGVVGTRGA